MSGVHRPTQRNLVLFSTVGLIGYVSTAPTPYGNGVTHEEMAGYSFSGRARARRKAYDASLSARFEDGQVSKTNTTKRATSVAVRKSLTSMSVEEQTRFLESVAEMQRAGKGGPFELAARYHGWSSPSEYHCVHGKENFPHWHRLHLLQFENALQDAHETKFGNRDIGLPYWDWIDDSLTHVFDPSVRDLLDALGTSDQMELIMGSAAPGGDDKNADKIYKNGFVMRGDDSLYSHNKWPSIRDDLNSFLRRTPKMRHKTAADEIEQAHNGVHVVSGKPMSGLTTAPYSVYFWIHHANIDRYWEAYIAQRAITDGDRSVVEAEFAAPKKSKYHDWLEPFLKPDGSQWTSEGTFNTVDLGYQYDVVPTHSDAAPLPVDAPALCSDDKKICKYVKDGSCDDGGPGASFSDCPLGSDCTDCGSSDRTALKEMTAQSASTGAAFVAVISFGKDADCALDHTQPSFDAHFFLFAKNSSGSATMPKTTAELAVTDLTYVGAASLFGGMPTHADAGATTPVTLTHKINLPAGTVPAEYEVAVLYAEADAEDPDALLETPTFFVKTAGCGDAAPVPDASWVTLEVAD